MPRATEQTIARLRRILQGNTQREAARRLGVNERTVRKWLSGKNRPNKEHREKITRVSAGILGHQRRTDQPRVKRTRIFERAKTEHTVYEIPFSVWEDSSRLNAFMIRVRRKHPDAIGFFFRFELSAESDPETPTVFPPSIQTDIGDPDDPEFVEQFALDLLGRYNVRRGGRGQPQIIQRVFLVVIDPL